MTTTTLDEPLLASATRTCELLGISLSTLDRLVAEGLLEPVRFTPRAHRSMDHDADQHDDRAIALALACSKLLDRPISSGDADLLWDPRPLGGTVGTFGVPAYGDVL